VKYKDLMANIFKFAQGRHTFFALFFATTAFILALMGKLTGAYACTITAIQAFVLGHSMKQDHFDKDGDKG